MYSFQVSRKFDGKRLHIDEYLTKEPLTPYDKRRLVGDGMVFQETHEVPVVLFPANAETIRFRTDQLQQRLEAAKALVVAGIAK